MTDRRTVIADATIATIAREGLRGLTHRAVDRAAGLAEGSTSYYFRTRDALLFAALDRMAELDTEAAGALPNVGANASLDELTMLLTAMVRHTLTAGRERTVARYTLALESTRHPELRAKFVELGTGFRVMAEQFVAATGASDARRRGRTLVAFLEGLIYDHIAGFGELDDTELRAACRSMLRTALC